MTKQPQSPGGKYAALRTVTETPAVDTEPAPAEAVEVAALTHQPHAISAETAAIEQRIAEVLAKRPPRAQPATPRYGRRAQADMIQLGVVIPAALKHRLVVFARARDLQLAEATEVLLDLALSASGE